MSYIKEHKWSFIISGLALVIIAIVGFMLFHRPANSGPSQSNVSVSINAPQQISSGGQVIYTVTITNKETTGIKNVQLSMVYPNGFNFQSSTPNPTQLDGTLFNVPDIQPGESPSIIIKGTLLGNAGETKQVSATARYQFTSFNGQFVSQGAANTQISNSNITMSFAGPTSTSNGQNVTYTLVYGNATSQDLKNLSMAVSVPNNFTIISSNPQLDQSGNFVISDLPGGQNSTLTINGQFNGANAGQNYSFTAVVSGQDPNTGQTLSIANASYQVSISNAPLQLNATITGAGSGGRLPSGTTNVVLPGDNLNYTIKYQNLGTLAATNIQITATIVGSAVNLSSINAQNAVIQGNTATWNGSQVSQLSSLAPQASGNLTMRFAINNPATKGGDKNMQVQVNLSISSKEYPQGFNYSTPAQEIQTQVSSSDSVAYSSGANPPSVGNTSTYLVTVTLSNSTNDVKDGSLTFTMPYALGFDKTSVNSEESQNVSYNSGTNTLTWNVGTLAAHAGQFIAPRKLQFAESIQPSLTNVGNYITLAHHIQFTGADSYTNIPVNMSLQDLTTNSAGVGQVQP